MSAAGCSRHGHVLELQEWFYSPLFDVTHMRTLLVHHLEVECSFLGLEPKRVLREVITGFVVVCWDI